jgi:hypothetical protein
MPGSIASVSAYATAYYVPYVDHHQLEASCQPPDVAQISAVPLPGTYSLVGRHTLACNDGCHFPPTAVLAIAKVRLLGAW